MGNTDWTPGALPKGVYCSPGCGLGCKRKEYDKAIRKGAKLAARMGEGRTPEIWENPGRRYKVTKGVAAIHANSRRLGGGYAIFFNTEPQVVVDAKTPEDVLGIALQKARGIERQIAADCEALFN